MADTIIAGKPIDEKKGPRYVSTSKWQGNLELASNNELLSCLINSPYYQTWVQAARPFARSATGTKSLAKMALAHVDRKVQRRLQIWKFEFDESWSALTGVRKIDAHFTHRPSCNAQCLRDASLHRSRRVDTKLAGVRLCEVGLRSARFRRSSEGFLRKSLYEN